MNVAAIDRAYALLAGRERILVFTGAGISTESGIPDFRGPSGVWKTANPDDFTLANYLRDPEFRRGAWKRRFDSPLRHARPNAGHTAVADLWRSGSMIGCVTQNIDGLHQEAGLPPDAVVELHGNRTGIRCVECGTEPDPDGVEARWRDGEADPSCDVCGGILKTKIVMFGELLPPLAMQTASDWTAVADAVVVVGSTLSVYPAAALPLEVAARGKPMVIVNEGPTDHDDLAAIKLEGKAGTVLPRLVAMLAP